MDSNSESEDQGGSQSIPTPPPLPQPPQIYQTPQKKEDFVKPENCYSCQEANARDTLSHYDYERFKCRRVCVRRYCENCSSRETRRSSDKKLNKLNEGSHLNMRQIREYEDPKPEDYERRRTRPPLPEPQIYQTPQKNEDFVKPENCYSCQEANARDTLSHYDYERFNCRRVCVRRYCKNCSLKQSRRSSDKKLNTFFQRKLSLEETY
ncbi:uncharacterized protein LOC108112394 isoform X2 [Drosophila eugracilis]|uniref:uncharacterized protein LOC108112394 isoform X2 n=1 Tax=Drosophila eugracilis TaxID=29029 RepID=UPI0007E6B63B|nr:uncharacterized protein LOC108112394 isoform X2 [Drosophila eugracilis]